MVTFNRGENASAFLGNPPPAPFMRKAVGFGPTRNAGKFVDVRVSSTKVEDRSQLSVEKNCLENHQKNYSRSDIIRSQLAVKEFTREQIPVLRERWMTEISDLIGPIPLELPPLWEVNHDIYLIDESRTIKHRYAKCPDYLCPELLKKVEKYTAAGWWEEKNVPSAVPLLCIPKTKKDPSLRTVIDSRDESA
jgi:hypothetical protein